MVVVDGFIGSDPRFRIRAPRRQGRTDEYDAMAARLKRERKEFPSPGPDEPLARCLG